MDSKGRTVKNTPLWLMTVALVFWIVFLALLYEIESLISSFLLLPLLAVVVLATAIVFVVCIVMTIKFWKVNGFSRAVGARIIGVVLFPVLLYTLGLVRVDDLYERARFSVLAAVFDNAAQEMVAMDDSAHVTPLPIKYAFLSRGGGEVVISGTDDNKVILFFRHRGILGSASYYVYAPNEQAYENMLEYESWRQIIFLREHWYFCD